MNSKKISIITIISIFHSNMSVRSGEAADIESMMDILEHACRRDALIDLFERSIETESIESFVFLSENLPIGLAIIGFVICFL